MLLVITTSPALQSYQYRADYLPSSRHQSSEEQSPSYLDSLFVHTIDTWLQERRTRFQLRGVMPFYGSQPSSNITLSHLHKLGKRVISPACHVFLLLWLKLIQETLSILSTKIPEVCVSPGIIGKTWILPQTSFDELVVFNIVRSKRD